MDLMAIDQERLEPVSILVVEADPLRRRWIEHALLGGRYHVMTVAWRSKACSISSGIG